ncbi:MAG: fumarylacetoacetate hydrolase family protein [Burkholderiaceae bacterium]|jgi:5-oxopent-3-ene-1,2,5-tricarboxylate decarboxylase/2-hydroxyhepta-2,4-diene-1,7-dioate isomerase
MLIHTLPTHSAPWTWAGTVYGVMLNHRPALEALGDAVQQPPYQAAPKAPVLYIKPRNTHAGPGAVMIPPDVSDIEVGACLGLVIGQTTRNVAAADALEHVAGYLTVADLRVPHASLYRPSVKLIARDGFCRMASSATPRAHIANPDELDIRVWVDDILVQQSTTGNRVRAAAQLLADVSSFMTLAAGDILLLGVSHGAPRVQPGQSSRIEIGNLEPLQNHYLTTLELP